MLQAAVRKATSMTLMIQQEMREFMDGGIDFFGSGKVQDVMTDGLMNK